MNGRRTAGAVAGALVAGLGLTALMMAQEKKNGKGVGADRSRPGIGSSTRRASCARCKRPPEPEGTGGCAGGICCCRRLPA